MRLLAPPDFLSNCIEVADPPFCFSCQQRRAYCNCSEGPLSKQDWYRGYEALQNAMLRDWTEVCFALCTDPYRMVSAKHLEGALTSYWDLLSPPVFTRRKVWKNDDKAESISFPFTIGQLKTFLKGEL